MKVEDVASSRQIAKKELASADFTTGMAHAKGPRKNNLYNCGAAFKLRDDSSSLLGRAAQ